MMSKILISPLILMMIILSMGKTATAREIPRTGIIFQLEKNSEYSDRILRRKMQQNSLSDKPELLLDCKCSGTEKKGMKAGKKSSARASG